MCARVWSLSTRRAQRIGRPVRTIGALLTLMVSPQPVLPAEEEVTGVKEAKLIARDNARFRTDTRIVTDKYRAVVGSPVVANWVEMTFSTGRKWGQVVEARDDAADPAHRGVSADVGDRAG